MNSCPYRKKKPTKNHLRQVLYILHFKKKALGQTTVFLSHALPVAGKQEALQRTHTANFVDILERQTQRFVSWTSRWQDTVQSFKEGGSTGIAILSGNLPSLEPGHLEKKKISPGINSLPILIAQG